MRNRLARLRDRIGTALCALGLLLLLRDRRRVVGSAWGADNRMYDITAPAWCATDADEDAGNQVRIRVQRGHDPQLPPGWRLEPREESRP